ncbi:replication initiator protein [Dipodfec virus UOA04_Rod_1040]|nr:replication initiator protein [Dipodfec virus UOA04_Rod_1040]
MKCLNPIWINYSDRVQFRRKCFLAAKGYSDISDFEDFSKGCYVPCGKCAVCKERRKSAWMLRNTLEYLSSDSAYFFTLTYNDDHLPLKVTDDGVILPVVRKRDIQLFLKRLRKSLDYKIRYFVVSEYGPKTFRPHYHGIIYNIHREDLEKIGNAWSNGFVKVDPVTPGRIAYCSSYCFDDLDLTQDHEKNFLLASRRPAIGGIDVVNDRIIEYVRRVRNGRIPISSPTGETFFYRIPKYLMEKIFSDSERLKISFDSYESNLQTGFELNEKQKEWMLDRIRRYGYDSFPADFYDNGDLDVIKVLHSPLDGSPLGLEKQRGEEFTRKCLAKRKMTKGKTEFT